jgi:hypothetical protein
MLMLGSVLSNETSSVGPCTTDAAFDSDEKFFVDEEMKKLLSFYANTRQPRRTHNPSNHGKFESVGKMKPPSKYQRKNRTDDQCLSSSKA